ncbi:Lrp/AsnC family transcriptional regulator [Candidatus Obscuribacterales bacterium]|nr:Lrp/AsnC family transcriptional regulator [Candidatus Obscuribacterales bacterium]MBX3135207.1 Lrp/AsnC family transcriptional regulator [Candidatus Obscuribacterales bacterium]MBX3148684.1 Lrp/AsnC family transcriptional regulator [Candidatus Obscuribacterales bacterium]
MTSINFKPFLDSVLNFNTMDSLKSREILELLSNDSRTSAETIAGMLGLAPSQVKSEIDRFEQEGIIKHYGSTIDWEKAGIEKIVAFVDIDVVPAREVGFDAIALRIAKHPEVKHAWLVSGGCDLSIMVEANSLKEVANFVAEKIATIDGVTGTNTHFLLRKYKEDNVLFGDLEPDSRLVVSP